jgi:aryl-alcohol dehydrogenase-like predicted oxidoreductase
MQKRRLGQSDLEVTVLTFGCWQAGGKEWSDTNDDDSIAAMRAAFDAGINFFDTAEVYGGGHSEEIVAKALGDKRDQLLIATKVGAYNLAAEKVKMACEDSLRRLATDVIDLYQVHWPAGTWNSPIVPIEETMAALLELKEAGKIRAIGVSNFNGEQIEEALQYGRIDSLQPPYSLLFQPYVQNGTVDVCLKHEIGVIPYSPLAQGLLTGKFNRENKPTDNRAGNHLFKDPVYDLALQAVDGLKPIAAKYGCDTGQLSLAWLIAQPGVTSAIVGARTPDQIRGNVAAAGITLGADDLSAISLLAQPVLDAVSPEKTNPWK